VNNEAHIHPIRSGNHGEEDAEVHVTNLAPDPEVSAPKCPLPGPMPELGRRYSSSSPWYPGKDGPRTFIAPSVSSIVDDQPLVVCTPKSELADLGAHLQVHSISQQEETVPGARSLAPPVDFSLQGPALVADTGLYRSESSSLLTRSNSEPISRNPSQTLLSIPSQPIDSVDDGRIKPEVYAWESERWVCPHTDADPMIRQKTRTWVSASLLS
jgi:hypothetical protein